MEMLFVLQFEVESAIVLREKMHSLLRDLHCLKCIDLYHVSKQQFLDRMEQSFTLESVVSLGNAFVQMDRTRLIESLQKSQKNEDLELVFYEMLKWPYLFSGDDTLASEQFTLHFGRYRERCQNKLNFDFNNGTWPGVLLLWCAVHPSFFFWIDFMSSMHKEESLREWAASIAQTQLQPFNSENADLANRQLTPEISRAYILSK